MSQLGPVAGKVPIHGLLPEHRSRTSLVEHRSHDSWPPPSTPTKHLQSVLGKTDELSARMPQNRQR